MPTLTGGALGGPGALEAAPDGVEAEPGVGPDDGLSEADERWPGEEGESSSIGSMFEGALARGLRGT